MELGLSDISTITTLFQATEGWLVALLIVLPRIYGFILSSQLLPATAVPRLARTVAILVLGMPMAPLMLPFAPEVVERGAAGFAALFAKEFALGFIMGFVVSWIFWSIQAAGAFIDNQRGAAIASSIDPLQGHESSPLGLLFSQGFITYFFAVGGFLVITGILYNSYAIWPVTEFLPIYSAEFPRYMLEILDLGMRLCVIFAGPIIAVMFFAEFSLAMVSRFAPQVQVFILAMPIKSGIAVFLLIFYMPIMMRYAFDEASGVWKYTDRLFETLHLGASLP